jgi:hypothetical protein
LQIKENLQIIMFKINVTYTDYITKPAAIVDGKLVLSCLSVRTSGCPHGTTVSTGRIFRKCDICEFFENISRTFEFHYNVTRVTGTLHEDLCTFMIISRLINLRMRDVTDKICRDKTHFL